MEETPMELLLNVSLADGDPVELETLVRQLRDELAEVRSVIVNNAPGKSAPPGTKGVEDWAVQFAIGALSSGAVTLVFELLKAWADRHQALPVKITVRVAGKDSAQVEYDPTKTSARQLEALVKTLKSSGKS